MEGWKNGRVEERIGRLEGWKGGREDWKGGRVEEKGGRVEGWKVGRVEEKRKIGRVEEKIGRLGGNSMDNDFGKRVKARRLALGMTQNELARVSGLTQSTISHFETGVRFRPDFSSLVKLSAGLQCSVDYLLGKGELDIADLLADPRMLEMLEGMQRFSDARKAELLRMYEFFKAREDLASSQGIRPTETLRVSDRRVV